MSDERDHKTLRDEFAIAALIGLVMSECKEPLEKYPRETIGEALRRGWKDTAYVAYVIADAMIDARLGLLTPDDHDRT